MKITSKLALIFIIVILCQCNQKQEAEVPPPNVLWLVSEDNSPFIGAYGDTYAITPVLDSLAKKSIVYTHAFAAAPVCAPNRNTLITGMYANSLGTENMRSGYAIPEEFKFYPHYLKEAGYYVTNNAKKDYNTVDQPSVWHESSREATYQNRPAGMPFFHIQNFGVSHEGQIHKSTPTEDLIHNPDDAPIPPYHPSTPEMKHDWAQYYDQVTMMDSQIGDFLKQLEANGLSDSTIIFYYSDHGGVLGRSKRFIYESGLHIPLLVYFPPMYQHLAPAEPGSQSQRIISFVDLSPTLLSLCGLAPPQNMQGQPFLGNNQAEPRKYAYSFRGRMDERMDLVRSVRDKKYRYVKNYMPHKIYGQYIEYLWRAPSMASWDEAFKAGELNEVQSRFFLPKPPEELYDVENDPHNIHNLANNPEYQAVLNELREANREWLVQIKDIGFIPEAMIYEISRDTTIYDFARSAAYDVEKVVEVAETASSGKAEDWDTILSYLQNEDPIVRYWGATGCLLHPDKSLQIAENLATIANDSQENLAVRIAASEALFSINENDRAVQAIIKALNTDDNLMARVQAINVLDTYSEVSKAAEETIDKLVASVDKNNRNYDIRAARRLLQKWQNNS